MNAFSELEDSLVEKVRLRRGEPCCPIGDIDSESSRSVLPRSQNGIDDNKNVKGAKRNIMTDNDGDILKASFIEEVKSTAQIPI